MNIKIPKELLDFGLDYDTIKFLYSKTRLGKYTELEIESIVFVKYVAPDSILLRLNIVRESPGIVGEGLNISPKIYRQVYRRQMVMQLSKSKLRQDKINKILNENNNG